MSDYDYLGRMSGVDGRTAKQKSDDCPMENGGLALIADACVNMNTGLTRVLDAFLGPDGTDAFDASCNTCAHFQRERFDRKTHNPSVFGFRGKCARDGRAVLGWPRGQFCGIENGTCYENRRTRIKHGDVKA